MCKRPVSIAVPVYNSENYRQTRLNSIRAHTWTELEIIAVDDGSTDRSRDINRENTEQDAVERRKRKK